jgi:hypothetical protein
MPRAMKFERKAGKICAAEIPTEGVTKSNMVIREKLGVFTDFGTASFF